MTAVKMRFKRSMTRPILTLSKWLRWAGLLLLVVPSLAGVTDGLEREFMTPPHSARPHVYWYWMMTPSPFLSFGQCPSAFQ